MLWFSHFSMEGMRRFKYGAYALAHYCLAHRWGPRGQRARNACGTGTATGACKHATSALPSMPAPHKEQQQQAVLVADVLSSKGVCAPPPPHHCLLCCARAAALGWLGIATCQVSVWPHTRQSPLSGLAWRGTACREDVWELLVWEGKHPQAPVAVASKTHYFCELALVPSVKVRVQHAGRAWMDGWMHGWLAGCCMHLSCQA